MAAKSKPKFKVYIGSLSTKEHDRRIGVWNETAKRLGIHLPNFSMKLAHIYFIAGADLVKIGIAEFPQKRCADLQIGSPVPLEILATCRGTAHHEYLLHHVFAEDRSHGEWFHRSEWVDAAIEQALSGREPEDLIIYQMKRRPSLKIKEMGHNVVKLETAPD